MAQHDYNISNAPGATVRADINALAEAIGSQNSGASAPSVTFPNMFWFDTTVPALKVRNNANTSWGLFGSTLGLAKADVGLGSVDDTADSAKPVSTAQAAAILIAQSETLADNIQTGTTYTFLSADKGKSVGHNSTSAGVYSIDTVANQPMVVNKTTIILMQLNTGQMSIAALSGVKILSEGGTTAGNDGKRKLTGFGAQASLKYLGSDTWLLAGNITT
jgi:hypothetical protein